MFRRRERRGVERQAQGGELLDSLRAQVLTLDPSGIGIAPSAVPSWKPVSMSTPNTRGRSRPTSTCSSPGDATRLPAAGPVQLTVLTYTGHLRAEAAEEDLGRRRHAASPVYHAMHAVITALRETESVHDMSGEHLPRTPSR